MTGIDPVLAGLDAAGAARTEDELAAAALATVVGAVDSDSALLRASARTCQWPEPFLSADDSAAFEAVHRSHPWPLATHTRSGPGVPLRSSDVLSHRQFHDTRMYAEVFRTLGVEWQVAFAVPAGADRRLCVVLNRDAADFTAAELARLARLRRLLAVDAARVDAAQIDAVQIDAESQAAVGDSVALDSLTAREREVLRLVAAGQGNGQIGRRLGISARTVDKHLEHIYGKTRVQCRTQAAVLWSRTRFPVLSPGTGRGRTGFGET